MDAATRQAVLNTENEILDFVFDTDRDSPENFTDDDISDLELDQTEGWNGLPLDDSEIAARNLFGDHPDGFDRPLELQEQQDRDEAMLASNQQLIDQLARAQAERDTAILEERKRAMVGDVVTYPEKVIDYALAQDQELGRLRQEVDMHRVNNSLQYAHHQHGDEFERAYSELTSLPKTDANKALVQEIWNDPNPGNALMEWHGDKRSAGRSRRSGLNLPSLNSRTPAVSRSRGNEDRSGWSDSTTSWGGFDEEEDIFRSATR
jgi:hypothetical protein